METVPAVLCFGEILFDVFGSEKHIGGAPFNFAAHFSRLGGNSFMLSALGRDSLGDEALCEVKKYGVSPEYIAVLDGVPTGICRVTLDNGKPEYELVKNVSYDFIPCPRFERSFDAVYFGTLASRSDFSRDSLRALLSNVKSREVFFDVNIRQSFWDINIIEEYLEKTTVLKFSREEAHNLGGGSLTELCRSICHRHGNIRTVVVTLDSDGAFAYDQASDSVTYSRRPQAKVVSTVGAGDSFSAAFIYNRLKGASVEECLEQATRLAEKIVSQEGAV